MESLLVPETYAPLLLRKRAARLTALTGLDEKRGGPHVNSPLAYTCRPDRSEDDAMSRLARRRFGAQITFHSKELTDFPCLPIWTSVDDINPGN